MSWPIKRLGEVFEIARGGSPRPIDRYITDDPNGYNWIMIGDAPEGSKYITTIKKKITPDGLAKTRQVRPGDFLLTNSMSFGRPYILKTSGCIHDGWLVLSPRLADVSTDYFYYLLGSDSLKRQFLRGAAGAVVKNLNTTMVKAVTVPLPPLAEQKRIAGILDAADALRAKRREALAQLDTLLQSTFLDMFGDPVTNPLGWEERVFGRLVSNSFRNGLSPSNKGTVEGEVLTLAAITGGGFDFTERKAAHFDKEPSPLQRPTAETFLICRGNGNKKLVGTAAFPDHADETVCFPDTMIGVTIDSANLSPAYLQSVWRSRRVRDQIESGARTTNGTYKVNQKVLASIVFPVPPLDLQRRFAAIVESVEQQKARMRTHLTELDALFASLQDRAFKGEL